MIRMCPPDLALVEDGQGIIVAAYRNLIDFFGG
jgi:hypothetical protein